MKTSGKVFIVLLALLTLAGAQIRPEDTAEVAKDAAVIGKWVYDTQHPKGGPAESLPPTIADYAEKHAKCDWGVKPCTFLESYVSRDVADDLAFIPPGGGALDVYATKRNGKPMEEKILLGRAEFSIKEWVPPNVVNPVGKHYALYLMFVNKSSLSCRAMVVFRVHGAFGYKGSGGTAWVETPDLDTPPYGLIKPRSDEGKSYGEGRFAYIGEPAAIATATPRLFVECFDPVNDTLRTKK